MNDRTDDATDRKEAGKQPTGNEGADDSNDDVADQAEADRPSRSWPASQPATAPMTRKMMSACGVHGMTSSIPVGRKFCL